MSVYEAFEVLWKEAQGLTQSKDYDAAEQRYNDLINQLTIELSKTPDNDLKKVNELLSLAYNDRGLVKYRKVNFYDAMDDYSLALTYAPRLAAAYYNRGLICYRLGNFTDAIKDMNAALEIDPYFISAQECKKQAETDELLRRGLPEKNRSGSIFAN